MTDQFPDATKMVPVPPPELVGQWMHESNHHGSITSQVAAFAAQWGADQELAACCEVLIDKCFVGQATLLREWRRPKPSLKEQALKALDRVPEPGVDSAYLRQWLRAEAASLINDVRRALEALPND